MLRQKKIIARDTNAIEDLRYMREAGKFNEPQLFQLTYRIVMLNDNIRGGNYVKALNSKYTLKKWTGSL